MTERPRVEIDLFIDAQPETVWAFWVDANRIAEWWGSAATLEPTPGGLCRVAMGDGGPVMRGAFVELIPHERIVFTFGWEGHDEFVAPGSTRVEVDLTPKDGGTALSLRHFGLPPTAASSHDEGWSHFLPILSTVAADAEQGGER